MASRKTSILQGYIKALDDEIAREHSDPKYVHLVLLGGKITGDNVRRVRGYFDGLKTARKMLDKQIEIYEESIANE